MNGASCLCVIVFQCSELYMGGCPQHLVLFTCRLITTTGQASLSKVPSDFHTHPPPTLLSHSPHTHTHSHTFIPCPLLCTVLHTYTCTCIIPCIPWTFCSACHCYVTETHTHEPLLCFAYVHAHTHNTLTEFETSKINYQY